MANSTLRAPLLPVFSNAEPEARLQRVWRGIHERRNARRYATFWGEHAQLIVAAATASCLIILAAFAWRVSGVPTAGKPRLPAAMTFEASSTPRDIDFGDGAWVSVHAQARLDVLEHTDHVVVLALRRGFAQFDIRPGGARRWRIESGGVTVEVVGTRFSVERRETSVQVQVQRGRVLVRGAGVADQVQSLDAGKSLVVQLVNPTAHDAAITESSARSAGVASGAAAPPSAPARAVVVSAPASASAGVDWHGAATRQDWHRAWQNLGAEGVAREAAHTDDVADLLALADVARLSGHPQQALAPLRLIVGSHSDDPRAAMAAFTLGRVLLDALGQPMQASFAFERALTLKLPASLAEDALARLVESRAKAGDENQARAAANAYRASYPNGRRLADVNRWSSPE